jgi:hypothetical protein
MRKTSTLFLVPVFLLALVPAGLDAQETPRENICLAVFGVGELSVLLWTDDEPWGIGGEFEVAVDTAANLVAYLDTEPERLQWYDGRFSLLAYPGSDAPLPGDLSWAPCDSTWLLQRPGETIFMTSFCESTTVPDPDEPGDIYEIFVREEIAALSFLGTRFDCGRLHLNGQWDPDAEPQGQEVTVSGKICQCGPVLGSRQHNP